MYVAMVCWWQHALHHNARLVMCYRHLTLTLIGLQINCDSVAVGRRLLTGCLYVARLALAQGPRPRRMAQSSRCTLPTHNSRTKFILSSAWGGASRPPSQAPIPLRGPVGQPHALPFGMSRAINTTTQTPSGRGSRATLPGSLGPALVLTPPPIPSRQADRGLRAAPRASEAERRRGGGQGLSR